MEWVGLEVRRVDVGRGGFGIRFLLSTWIRLEGILALAE